MLVSFLIWTLNAKFADCSLFMHVCGKMHLLKCDIFLRPNRNRSRLNNCVIMDVQYTSLAGYYFALEIRTGRNWFHKSLVTINTICFRRLGKFMLFIPVVRFEKFCSFFWQFPYAYPQTNMTSDTHIHMYTVLADRHIWLFAKSWSQVRDVKGFRCCIKWC